MSSVGSDSNDSMDSRVIDVGDNVENGEAQAVPQMAGNDADDSYDEAAMRNLIDGIHQDLDQILDEQHRRNAVDGPQMREVELSVIEYVDFVHVRADRRANNESPRWFAQYVWYQREGRPFTRAEVVERGFHEDLADEGSEYDFVLSLGALLTSLADFFRDPRRREDFFDAAERCARRSSPIVESWHLVGRSRLHIFMEMRDFFSSMDYLRDRIEDNRSDDYLARLAVQISDCTRFVGEIIHTLHERAVARERRLRRR